MNRRIGIVLLILGLAGVFALAVFGLNRFIYSGRANRLCESADMLFKQGDSEGAIKKYEEIINNFPKSKAALKAQLYAADIYMAAGRLLEARDIYKNLSRQNLELDIIRQIYQKLGDLNIKILFSPIKTPDSITYRVQEKDTLQDIAKKYNTTVALIKKANNKKGEVIRPGMYLKITTAKFSTVVDKSQNILTLKSGEEALKTYPVSTGADNSTPIGTFQIVSKIVSPPWFSGGKVIPPGDPKNILGTRWLGLTLKSYGIHGTTDDLSIGKQCTQGCVRMHNKDVEELHDIVPVGTEVTIVD